MESSGNGTCDAGQIYRYFGKERQIVADCYIWELACRQLRRWKDEGREDMYISLTYRIFLFCKYL